MIKRVVIWGDDHHNALGLLRMLGGRGFDILLIVSKVCNIATASKYCTSFVEIPCLEDGLKFLHDNYLDKENKAVLLFTADKYAEIANKNLSYLRDFFFICGSSEEGLLEQIDNKYVMGQMAKECGFNVPRTLLLPRDIEKRIDEYPVILKPCRPVDKDFKTLIVKNLKEYDKAKKKLIPGKEYVAQQFINKLADCLVYGCRTQSGKTIIAGACVRNRWSDDGCGSFGYITQELPLGVSELAISRFLSQVNFIGLFSVEYALTKDNAFFYEFNLRNDGTSHLFLQAGSNIALAFVNDCFGETTTEPTLVNGKQYLINEFWDRFNVNDGIVSREQYEKDFNRSTIFFYYDSDDMQPYNIQKSQSTWRGLRRVISKSRINKMRLKIKNRYFRKIDANESNHKR